MSSPTQAGEFPSTSYLVSSAPGVYFFIFQGVSRGTSIS